MKENISKISLDLPLELKDKLVTLAKDQEMSLSGYIRLIIKRYLTPKNKDEDTTQLE